LATVVPAPAEYRTGLGDEERVIAATGNRGQRNSQQSGQLDGMVAVRQLVGRLYAQLTVDIGAPGIQLATWEDKEMY